METKEFIKYLKSKGVTLNYGTAEYPSTIWFPYHFITENGIQYPISQSDIKRARHIRKKDWTTFGNGTVRASVRQIGATLRGLIERFGAGKKKSIGVQIHFNFRSVDQCNDFYGQLMDRLKEVN